MSLASLEPVTLPAPERPGDAWVLRDVTFQVPAGKLTALVGPSGAGKTTITHLVPRLYDPVRGAVRIGGHDVRDLTLESLRSVVGVVPQDAHLFHDTIRANLLYARPSATEKELIEACEAARIWELISSLPDGLDTIAGDRGYRFSGGEKQRVALARLLLKAPSVVVLDEATAHLDSESEVAIQRALATALAGRTSLVIAHRLSTVRAADQILVVDGGQIAERGTHDELLAAGGVYAGLYRTQFAPQAALRSFLEEGNGARERRHRGTCGQCGAGAPAGGAVRLGRRRGPGPAGAERDRVEQAGPARLRPGVLVPAFGCRGGVVRAGTRRLPGSGHDAAEHRAAPAGLLEGPGHLPVPVRGRHPPARPGASPSPKPLWSSWAGPLPAGTSSSRPRWPGRALLVTSTPPHHRWLRRALDPATSAAAAAEAAGRLGRPATRRGMGGPAGQRRPARAGPGPRRHSRRPDACRRRPADRHHGLGDGPGRPPVLGLRSWPVGHRAVAAPPPRFQRPVGAGVARRMPRRGGWTSAPARWRPPFASGTRLACSPTPEIPLSSARSRSISRTCSAASALLDRLRV